MGYGIRRTYGISSSTNTDIGTSLAFSMFCKSVQVFLKDICEKGEILLSAARKSLEGQKLRCALLRVETSSFF
jgi:hypothetical protein